MLAIILLHIHNSILIFKGIHVFFCITAVVNGCAIHRTKILTKHIPNEKRSTFSCYKDRDIDNKDSEIHVVSMYGQTGQEKSFLKLNLANKSRRKDVILVLANFLKTEWILYASDMVKTNKIYIVSFVVVQSMHVLSNM